MLKHKQKMVLQLALPAAHETIVLFATKGSLLQLVYAYGY